MANLPSSFSYVNDVEVAQDAPITENLNAKLGSNTNYLYDQNTTNVAAIASIKTSVNLLDTTMKVVTSGFTALAADIALDYSFYLWKDGTTTYLRVFRLIGTSPYTKSPDSNVDLGVNATTWDFGLVHGFRSGLTYRIYWQLMLNVTIPNP